MRNTLREFRKLSRQSPRSRACTDFDSLLVIAAIAKVSCKHGLWLVARVNQKAGMPHDTPYLEYSTISLLFCHEYFSLFPAIFVFYHTGFFVFIEKDQFAFSPPVCYTVFIYFRNYFFIHRKAYNL